MTDLVFLRELKVLGGHFAPGAFRADKDHTNDVPICCTTHPFGAIDELKEALNKSFDKLRMNGKVLIPFVVSLSNHERNPLVQSFLKEALIKSLSQ